MVAYTKCTAAVEPLLEAINCGTDTWKVALSNSSAVGKTSFTPGTDDLATNAFGYTQGGNACAVSSSTQVAGTYKLVLSSPASWSATGTWSTFQYAILWNVTQGVPVGQWDYGSGITMSNGDAFTVTLDGTNGVFQVV